MSSELHEMHEHAEHAKHDPSIAPVTLTLAVLAVLVALVSLLGHRASTEQVSCKAKLRTSGPFFRLKHTPTYGRVVRGFDRRRFREGRGGDREA